MPESQFGLKLCSCQKRVPDSVWPKELFLAEKITASSWQNGRNFESKQKTKRKTSDPLRVCSPESSPCYSLSLFSVCLQVRDIEFQSSEAPTVKTQTIRDPAPQIRLDIQVITSQYLDIKRKIIGYQITLPLWDTRGSLPGAGTGKSQSECVIVIVKHTLLRLFHSFCTEYAFWFPWI